MDRQGFFHNRFISALGYPATPCQDALFRSLSSFVTGDDGDILVVNGYAGTGKTTAVAAVVSVMSELEVPCILLAPTGRSAKVLSSYTGRPASTIHKHIYRQKGAGSDGIGVFTLSYNKARGALFVVDEVSLMGTVQNEGGAVFGSGDLLGDLVSFVRSGMECKLVLIGDSAQLPPVGMEVSPALDPSYMQGFGGVSFASLTTVVRQQKESGILHNATILRTLVSDPQFTCCGLSDVRLSSRGFPDVERISGGELLEALEDAYSRYGEDETIVLARSNKRTNIYNAGIRSRIQYKEEELCRGDRLMIVKNCYHFLDENAPVDYIANGDMATLRRISHFEERYGLHFADATLQFSDYGSMEVDAKVILDTLSSETASLSYEMSDALFKGVSADYSHITSKKKRYDAVREDPFYNALQLKYACAITAHKSQGGQWNCVFIDNPFWKEPLVADDLKWLYTSLTRAVEKVFLVNFKPDMFID